MPQDVGLFSFKLHSSNADAFEVAENSLPPHLLYVVKLRFAINLVPSVPPLRADNTTKEKYT